MEKSKLNHADPKILEENRINEIRQMTYQQRFDKFIAIYELSYLVKNAKKYSTKNIIDNERTNN